MDPDRPTQRREVDPVDDDHDDGIYHREVDDPGGWDEPGYAAPAVTAHRRGIDFGLVVLRLAGLGLVLHGLDKATDMPAFTQDVEATLLGDQAPEFFAWLVMLGQVALPLLIAVGLFTRPAAFLVAAMMAAVWVLGVGLQPGYTLLDEQGELTGEPALLYVGLTLPLVFSGAGRWSVDHLRTGGRP